MKTLLLLFVLSGLTFAQEKSMSGNLSSVEKLTPNEQLALRAALDNVDRANEGLRMVQSDIAAAHKMTNQSYMEWSTWYEFDGDYILQRHSSAMSSGVFTIPITKAVK